MISTLIQKLTQWFTSPKKVKTSVLTEHFVNTDHDWEVKLPVKKEKVSKKSKAGSKVSVQEKKATQELPLEEALVQLYKTVHKIDNKKVLIKATKTKSRKK
jgi:hypothetical protein